MSRSTGRGPSVAFLLVAGLVSVVRADPIDELAGRMMARQREDPSSNRQLAGWIATQLKDGTWPGIDYRDSTSPRWAPLEHVRRFRELAWAWHQRRSLPQADERLRGALVAAAEAYLARSPRSTNFWYNEIGEAIPWGEAILLAQGAAPDSTRARWALRIRGPWASYTGANLAWEATAHVYRSVVRRDRRALDSVFLRLRADLAPVDSGDGIHRDFAFSQHTVRRSFPYNGGYGQNYQNETIRWLGLLEGTPWAFPDRSYRLLDSLATEGDAWMVHGGFWDPTMVGRNLTRQSPLRAGDLARNVRDLQLLRGSRNLSLMSEWLEGKIPWFRKETDKVFWTSGYMAHHGPGWSVSLRAPRSDQTATESGNQENLKGWFLGMGSTWVRVKGDEYDGCWGIFDWSSVPGTTTDRVDTFPGQNNGFGFGYNYGTRSFVGGVSDGSSSVYAMDHDISGIRGRKAWFQSSDAFAALGAGFEFASPRPVSTTVDQKLARGPVVVAAVDGRVDTMETDSLATSSVKWVHHDSVGYWFPETESLRIGREIRNGDWREINVASTRIQRGRMFSLRIEHGTAAVGRSFLYVVVPGVSADSMASWVARTSWRAVSNTASVQAVRQGDWKAVVFHRAKSTVEFPDGLALETDRPCALLVRTGADGLNLRYGAPDRSTGRISLRWRWNGIWKHDILDLPGHPREGASEGRTFELPRSPSGGGPGVFPGGATTGSPR